MTSVSKSVEGTLSRQLTKSGFTAAETDAMVNRISGIPNLSDLDPTLLTYALIFYSTVLLPTAIQNPDSLPDGPRFQKQIEAQLIEKYGKEYRTLDSIGQTQLQTSFYRYLSIIDASQQGIKPVQLLRERL